jgi:hypothetical protein
MVQQKVLSALVDEEITKNYKKEMFIGDEYFPAERTEHKSIPPANVRIKKFQRRELS